MTLQSQHQENTYPNNYFTPNGSVYILLWLLSSVPQQLKGLMMLIMVIIIIIICIFVLLFLISLRYGPQLYKTDTISNQT